MMPSDLRTTSSDSRRLDLSSRASTTPGPSTSDIDQDSPVILPVPYRSLSPTRNVYREESSESHETGSRHHNGRIEIPVRLHQNRACTSIPRRVKGAVIPKPSECTALAVFHDKPSCLKRRQQLLEVDVKFDKTRASDCGLISSD
jgi:hypothetical protein